ANLAWIFLALAIVASLAGWLAGLPSLILLVLTALLSGAGGAGLSFWLRAMAREQTAARYRPLLTAVRLADESCRQYLQQSVARYKRQRSKIRRQRDTECQHAADHHAPILAACRRRREVDLPKLAAEANARLLVVQRKFDEDARVAEDLAARLTAEARKWNEQ